MTENTGGDWVALARLDQRANAAAALRAGKLGETGTPAQSAGTSGAREG